MRNMGKKINKRKFFSFLLDTSAIFLCSFYKFSVQSMKIQSEPLLKSIYTSVPENISFLLVFREISLSELLNLKFYLNISMSL